MKGSSERRAPQHLSAHPLPSHGGHGLYLIHSYISRAWHRDWHTADAQETFAALRGVDMQEKGENSAFWIDLQTSTLSAVHTPTHLHTTPSSSMETHPHHECHWEVSCPF